MPTISIDNKDYETDDLSEEARNQLGSLQAADAEIARLNVLLAIAQTARNAYAKALTDVLPETN